MKIAVAYENGQIFQHFGHTEQFKLYEAVDGKITHAKVVDTNGNEMCIRDRHYTYIIVISLTFVKCFLEKASPYFCARSTQF